MKIRHAFLTMAMAAVLAMAWAGGAGAGELTKVRFSYFPAFHTLAVYVAYQKGFYKDEGLDVQMIEAASGALQPIQLVSGDVDIASTELQNVVRLQHEGKKVIYVFDLVKRMSMDFVVHNDVLAKNGVKPTDPLDKKLQSLKGLKIGYTSPNSPSDVYSRFYLQKAGLVPGKDAEMVSIGSPPSLVAALKTKRIDAFQLTAPTSTVVEKEGFGTAIIRGSAGEVKELDDYPYYGMVIQDSFGAQRADVVKHFIRATRRGVAFMRSDLDGTVQAVQAFFKRMSPEILKAGVQTALPAYSDDGRINEQIVTRFLDLAYSVKLLTVPQRPSPKEGVLWTNKFIE
jgi:ABC-type nitrate/sulfonate/bicarbonate transport system substrate-binding protein